MRLAGPRHREGQRDSRLVDKRGVEDDGIREGREGWIWKDELSLCAACNGRLSEGIGRQWHDLMYTSSGSHVR